MIDILSKNAEKMTIMITNPQGKILICTDDMYSGTIKDEKVSSALTAESGKKLYTDIGGMLDAIANAHRVSGEVGYNDGRIEGDASPRKSGKGSSLRDLNRGKTVTATLDNREKVEAQSGHFFAEGNVEKGRANAEGGYFTDI